jgi:hypothetical protein
MQSESQNTHAWILLCVSEKGSTLERIIAVADAINHAIPTHKELQTSLGWLLSRGMVYRRERQFALTDAGSKLLAAARRPGRSLYETWDEVSAKLQTMIGATAPLADISRDEIQEAYDAYKRR